MYTKLQLPGSYLCIRTCPHVSLNALGFWLGACLLPCCAAQATEGPLVLNEETWVWCGRTRRAPQRAVNSDVFTLAWDSEVTVPR